MSSEKRTKKKRKKVEDRLERALERLAIVVVWDLVLIVLITNVSLMIFGTADMLQPLRALVLMGFIYWFFTSFFSVYIHCTEKMRERPISLFFKILLSIASIGASIYALPSVFLLEAHLQMNVSFDTPIQVAFAVGVSSVIIGVIFLTRRTLKSWGE